MAERIPLSLVLDHLLILFLDIMFKAKNMFLSTWREESDYVVQYNFYDATQDIILGEVVKDRIHNLEFIVHN